MAGAHRHRRHHDSVYMRRRIIAVLCVALFLAAAVFTAKASLQSLRERSDAIASSRSSVQSQQSSEQKKSAPQPTQEQTQKSASVEESQQSTEPEESAEEKALKAQQASLTDEEKTSLYNAAKQVALDKGLQPMVMRYCVASKGNVGDTQAFANSIYRILNDEQGWARAGVVFQEATDGNCDITMTLSAPEEVPSFSSMCSSEYSCRVGSDVIINKTRWDNGVEDWNKAGGTLDQYRIMVVSHEVGHALGHIDNEQTCGGEGQLAPLMQEQSMFLNGCKPNIHPLDSELWTTFVGPAA